MVKAGPLDGLLNAVRDLPPEQQRVLVPVLASMVVRKAPPGVQVPPGLQALMTRFWDSLPQGNVKAMESALSARFKAAGITEETFVSLAREAGTPAPPKSFKALAQEQTSHVAPATPPKAGQVRAATARITQKTAPAKKTSPKKK